MDASPFPNGIEMKEVADGTIDDDWFMSTFSLVAPKRLHVDRAKRGIKKQSVVTLNKIHYYL